MDSCFNFGSLCGLEQLLQHWTAFIASGGAIVAGMGLGWSAPAQLYYNPVGSDEGGSREYHVETSAFHFTWIVAVMSLGAAFMSIFTGYFLQRFGRKITLLLLYVPLAVGWVFITWARHVSMLYVGRFLLGLSTGGFTAAIPIYLGEIAQKEIRGIIGSYYQTGFTLGILLVYIIGEFAGVFWMNLISLIVLVVFGLSTVFAPETPLFYVSRNDPSSATKAFKRLRGSLFDPLPEIEEIKASLGSDTEHVGKIWPLLKKQENTKAIIISIGLVFFLQMSGINAVLFYATEIFESAGSTLEPPIATIIVGALTFVATLLSLFLVDLAGRRLLLLLSAGSMMIAFAFMGAYFYLKDKESSAVDGLEMLPLILLGFFVVTFSLGFGPVPFIILGEIFSAEIKGFASSLAICLDFIMSFVVSIVFPIMSENVGKAWSFWFFGAFSLLAIIFVVFMVPETKGKSLNEIQLLLKGKGNEQKSFLS